MGYYINPMGDLKENWLAKNGQLLDNPPLTHIVDDTNVVVCLVDNGWMTAAGVCYAPFALDAFKHDDGRPKMWYAVPIAKLKDVGLDPDIIRK